MPANPAATSAQKLPSVDQILAKYTQAIGGEKAYRKLTSRTARGTFVLAAAGISAPVEIYEKAPNKIVTTISIPGFGTIVQGYNGTVAFAQQPTSGVRELSGKELAKARREADFYDDLNLKEQYAKMIVAGVEPVGTAPAYRVEATTREGDTEQLYFDQASGLLVRKDEATASPEGMVPLQAFLEDYRTIDGIRYPFVARVIAPTGNFTITLTEVKHNVAIDNAKFDKPAAQ